MKKIVILGCENSHADTFLKYLHDCPEFSEATVVGVYSDDAEAMQKLHDTFGVPMMASSDAAVGKVDGVIVTARHGKHHLAYVRPYLADIEAVFIDKPFTIDEEEALTLARLCRERGVRLTGGSCLKFASIIAEAREAVLANEGKVLGAELHAPVSMTNDYGNFFFYSQHLVEMVCEAFGRFPMSVAAFPCGAVTTVVFRYPQYTVTGRFTEGYYAYGVTLHLGNEVKTSILPPAGLSDCFYAEFDAFYRVLMGGEQKETTESFVAPVFILNAIDRSLASGKEEAVRSFTL